MVRIRNDKPKDFGSPPPAPPPPPLKRNWQVRTDEPMYPPPPLLAEIERLKAWNVKVQGKHARATAHVAKWKAEYAIVDRLLKKAIIRMVDTETVKPGQLDAFEKVSDENAKLREALKAMKKPPDVRLELLGEIVRENEKLREAIQKICIEIESNCGKEFLPAEAHFSTVQNGTICRWLKFLKATLGEAVQP